MFVPVLRGAQLSPRLTHSTMCSAHLQQLLKHHTTGCNYSLQIIRDTGKNDFLPLLY